MRSHQPPIHPRRNGFTLIELLISVAIIAILASVMFALTGGLRKRAEQAACMANMTSLFTGLAAYTTDYKHWPQPPKESLGDEEAFWKFWFAVLEEYDITEKTWICPTHRRLSPPDEDPDKRKGSYIPAGFDASSASVPYRWNQPWLMEIGDNHGRGPFVIYPDGSIRPFSVRTAGPKK